MKARVHGNKGKSSVQLTLAATGTLLKEKGASTADYRIMRATATHDRHRYHYLASLLLPSDSWVRVTVTATYWS